MRIGDKVILINKGHIYTTFYKMFEKMNFNNTQSNYPDNLEIGSEFKIFSTGIHPDYYNERLIAIENDEGRQLLISEEGIRLSSRSTNIMTIGNKVTLTNKGAIYTTYDKKFKSMGFNNTEFNGDDGLKNGSKFKIFNIDVHDYGGTIFAIENDEGRQLLISEEGIRLSSRSTIIDKYLKDICKKYPNDQALGEYLRTTIKL